MRAFNLFFTISFLCSTLASTAQDSSINQYDQNGERHGEWKEYYDESNNLLKFEGEFVHGKEIGLFKFYQEGLKQPAAIMEFDPASDTVRGKYLTQKGKTISEGNLVNQQRTGLWTYYHKDSDEVMMIETYSNGKLSGTKKIFYPGGKLAEEANYVNGELHGPRKLFSVKGVVLEDLLYKNGELHGPAKFYNGKGELMSEGEYRNNKHSGIWKYFENGQLKEEKEFK
ncbi:Antitoxin component YwqK of the YwqJK toxin-antitoxin module [Salinimicrobium sediminis]|uniref:Antitoxin component YwqK of the YwqJK toxin-antitoxin module n=1 Tax=Salinimicrobium sediminis TaxID=1343891 RepID=A0A285X998_9FLAO|nr:hypothetical protein [Salinimicrobium sediminis]SOC81354.1 Antitoxin component YwqK of the YwqJK toxin-antitoxin module [Salinimicrobium sediminis]